MRYCPNKGCATIGCGFSADFLFSKRMMMMIIVVLVEVIVVYSWLKMEIRYMELIG